MYYLLLGLLALCVAIWHRDDAKQTPPKRVVIPSAAQYEGRVSLARQQALEHQQLIERTAQRRTSRYLPYNQR